MRPCGDLSYPLAAPNQVSPLCGCVNYDNWSGILLFDFAWFVYPYFFTGFSNPDCLLFLWASLDNLLLILRFVGWLIVIVICGSTYAFFSEGCGVDAIDIVFQLSWQNYSPAISVVRDCVDLVTTGWMHSIMRTSFSCEDFDPGGEVNWDKYTYPGTELAFYRSGCRFVCSLCMSICLITFLEVSLVSYSLYSSICVPVGMGGFLMLSV